MKSRRLLSVVAILFVFLLAVGCGSKWLAGGKLHFDQKRFEKAAEVFEKAVEEQPKNPEAHMWLGCALAELEQDERAAQEFLKALELNPKPALKKQTEQNIEHYWGVRMQRGLGLAKEAREAKLAGDVEGYKAKLREAADRFRRAIIFLPDSVRSHVNLGKVLYQLGEVDSALACFRRAKSMHFVSKGSLNFLFRVFVALGSHTAEAGESVEELTAGLDLLTQALEIERPQEDYLDVWYNIAVVHRKLASKYEEAGNDQKAKEHLLQCAEFFEKVYAADPSDLVVVEALGNVYHDLGDAEKAIEMTGKLVDARPWDMDYHLQMARAYELAGDEMRQKAHLWMAQMLGALAEAADPSTCRQEADKWGPGSDVARTLRQRRFPQEVRRYGSGGNEWSAWFYWTEGRAHIFVNGEEAFLVTFKRVSEEKLQERLGEGSSGR